MMVLVHMLVSTSEKKKHKKDDDKSKDAADISQKLMGFHIIAKDTATRDLLPRNSGRKQAHLGLIIR